MVLLFFRMVVDGRSEGREHASSQYTEGMNQIDMVVSRFRCDYQKWNTDDEEVCCLRQDNADFREKRHE